MSEILRKRLVILLFAAGFALWLWGINYSYVGIYNANNNYLSLAAKNYIRFGFTRLRFIPTYFAGMQLPTSIPYYLHHPILIFPLSTIPFMLFGFHNWVVHVTNLSFLIGDIYLLYKIGTLVWNKKIGLWAAGLVTIFPMTGFFWKYIFFEQGSLFFNLLVFYYFVRYIKLRKNVFLLYIFLFTFFGGLIDWGVLYLLFPFITFIFTAYKKQTLKVIPIYIIAAVASLSIFVGVTYVLQHGFSGLQTTIFNRAVTGELTSLSLWPLRLILISAVRIFIYFTPLVAVSIPYILLYKRRKILSELQRATLIFFFIFGLLNIVFLPTTTWIHSYFLFYFIPLFAFTGALYFEHIEHKTKTVIIWLAIIIISSTAVQYLKLGQVTKQLWKYDAALEVNKSLTPYETVGVVNFPGDVFENYFLHPTKPMDLSDLPAWRNGTKHTEVNKLVISYDPRGSTAELITRDSVIATQSSLRKLPGNTGGILELYRILRDTLGVVQI